MNIFLRIHADFADDGPPGAQLFRYIAIANLQNIVYNTAECIFKVCF